MVSEILVGAPEGTILPDSVEISPHLISVEVKLRLKDMTPATAAPVILIGFALTVLLYPKLVGMGISARPVCSLPVPKFYFHF